MVSDTPKATTRIHLELFEDFCVVTEAVREGIDVDVTVAGLTGGGGHDEPAASQPAP